VQNRAGTVVDSGVGGGIYLGWTMNTLIEENVIDLNYAGDSGGGIDMGGTYNTRVANNVITRNGCHVAGGGIRGQETLAIVGNLIRENWSDSFGGGIEWSAAIIQGNTIIANYINNPIFKHGAGLQISYGMPMIENNIVVFNHGPAAKWTGVGIKSDSDDGVTVLRCNDVWGNDQDYELFGSYDTTGLGNFSADPIFCDFETGTFELSASSPCAEDNSNACGPIGAYPVGCDIVPTEKITWGKLKRIYGKEGGK
jgi:Right handed beta helix region